MKTVRINDDDKSTKKKKHKQKQVTTSTTDCTASTMGVKNFNSKKSKTADCCHLITAVYILFGVRELSELVNK